jgi:hypothetical protein
VTWANTIAVRISTHWKSLKPSREYGAPIASAITGTILKAACHMGSHGMIELLATISSMHATDRDPVFLVMTLVAAMPANTALQLTKDERHASGAQAMN